MGFVSVGTPAARSGLNRGFALVIALTLALMLAAGISRPAKANPKFSAITVDATTGEVIYGNDIDEHRYPASLTKVMTLYILFQEIKSGRMSFKTRMEVSAKAAAQAPSKLGLRPGNTISARDAMLALITKSANDAAMVIAEHIGGSQADFADRMTRTARALGMTRTTFTNPNGLPDTRQVTTARDMATLGLRIQRDFPDYYKYFATRSFSYGKRRYGNHNRLLGRVKGVDGIKTGYTRASGFNLLSSMEVGNRRIVGVVLGARSGGSRNAFMTKILNRDVAKATRSRSDQVAAVAGKPKGYNPAAAAKVVAMARPEPSIETPPVPRAKPEDLVPVAAATPATQPLTAAEMAAVAAKAAKAASLAAVQQPVQEPQQKTVTELAMQALPQQGVTFKTVTVAAVNTKTDSLIVASAAKALPTPAPAPKLQTRLASNAAAAATPAPAIQKPAGTKVIANPAKVQEKLAEHQSTWNIQVGAFPTAEGAKSRIDVAKSSRVSALREATPFLMAVDKDGDTIYRARFSGLSKQQARNACKKLKRAGVGCFELAPQS